MHNTGSSRPKQKSQKKQWTMAAIIEGAIVVFKEKGYDNASIAEITSAANVAVGTLNNYFGNKERLGAYVTLALLRHTIAPVKAMLSFDDDPVLYISTVVSTYMRFMMETSGYRQFFLDALKYDFIFNYLSHTPNKLETYFLQHYKKCADQDVVMLHTQYLPYMLGRTLALKKTEGLFADLTCNEVVYLICHESLKDFVPDTALRKRVEESISLSKKLCEQLSDRPSMETISSVVLEKI